MTITVKRIFDAYPNNNELPFVVDEETTADDVADLEDIEGESLFRMLSDELCYGELTDYEAGQRLTAVIRTVDTIRQDIMGDQSDAQHLATLTASHTHTICNMQDGEVVNISLGSLSPMVIERVNVGNYRVGDTKAAVGNVFGALQWYMTMVLQHSGTVLVLDHV